jgi:hypothetical protein
MNTIVRIEWVDIISKTLSEDECMFRPTLPICISYGELEYQDSEVIVIVTERQGSDVTKQAFPTACVRKIIRLSEM